jgi:hypothetical protein
MSGWKRRQAEMRLAVIALAVIAAAALAAERLWLAAVQPLWFDESWTLAIATTPDWRAFVREAYVDVNAPLYYALMRAWTPLTGTSDLALRLPGLLAVAAAAAMPLARRTPGLALESRLALAAMLFAWWGVDIFLAGRCYGLLLALSTAQTLLFADLVRAPTLRRALAWSAVAALAILTHYYALILVAAQGLAYLALARGRALRSWPAALAFLPALAWLAWHAPRLQAFAGLDVAWHATLGAKDALAFTAFALNPSAPLVGLAASILALVAALAAGRAQASPTRPLAIAAAVSLAALALTLISGALRPSLTARYLIPTVPGLLLGLVLCAQRSRWPRAATLGLITIYLVAALRPAAFREGLANRAPYGFETASDVLMAHGVTDVVFAWDHEATRIMPASTMARLGAVFFRRAGAPAPVTPLVMTPADDVNPMALAAARGARPGIIWIYNRAGHTAAAAHPPRLPQLDPRWRCQAVGDATVGSLACWRPLPALR